MSTIQDLFQQAQLAEAAYANFFDNSGVLLTSQGRIQAALQDQGNNMSFSTAQATDFITHWRVVSQQPDTANGFSATVFESLDHPGQYSLAIRGSTQVQWALDFRNDANLIATDGVAVTQLVDMYNYWQSLTHLGVYQAAMLTTQLVATATLTALYASSLVSPSGLAIYETARSVLLSEGYIVERGTVYQLGFDLSTNVFTDSRQWGDNSLAGKSVSVDGHSLGGHLAMAFSRLVPGATVDAVAVNGLGFKIGNANVNNLFGQLGGAAGFDASKITNMVGSAGLNFASQDTWLLQQPAGRQNIYIESAGPGTWGGHSASQMTDSLAVYNLLATIDPALNLDTITGILKASSNVAANSLESTVSAIGKLFSANATTTTFYANEFDNGTVGRDKLYTALNDINTAVNCFSGTYTLRDLTGFTAAQIESIAQSNIAYRYALINLNPFALVNNDAVYNQHNTNGELDRYNPSTGNGEITDAYLTDRAAMLALVMQGNAQDSTVAEFNLLGSNYYEDIATGIKIDPYIASKRIIFGGDNADTLEGNALKDRLYGGAGNDTLNGGAGNDYIEGNAGNDTLTGGTGDDILIGGAGADTYHVGEGQDTILDSDGLGSIYLGADLLAGGESRDGGHTYQSADGSLTLQHYHSGDLGLTLGDVVLFGRSKREAANDARYEGERRKA